MLDGFYILGVLVIVFAVTFALRAVPFTVIKPLRESRFARAVALWMPVGILGILTANTFGSAAFGGTGAHLIQAIAASAVTVAVHLLFGRRTLLSVGLGTLTFMVLVNIL